MTENLRTIDRYLVSLSHIFETADIYQSVIICPNAIISHIYTRMMAEDYPVVRFNDASGVASFIDSHSRTLLVSESEIFDFQKCCTMLCPRVNVVISLGMFDCDDFEDLFDGTSVEFIVA